MRHRERAAITRVLCAALLAASAAGRVRAQRAAPGDTAPPPIPREMRAVWIATVANIDWPSAPGLSPDSQRTELIALLDRAAALNLNAVIFQVRPQADAMYASALEPWSPFLTGVMGRPPDPFYDPLAFLVREAHARGLEVHVWLNPYRALHPSSPGAIAPSHVSASRRDLVRPYGRYVWLDPGDPVVRALTRRVVLDLVRRYDIDGVHIDDYFYPYPEREGGREVPFPDDSTWARYRAEGGHLTRADWRRRNVDELVLQLANAVHRTKPFVKFGVSPFGIWRPGHPSGVKGFDAYDLLYADSRRWIRDGWVDYITPQLYWPVDRPGLPYGALLGWWVAQNVDGRHVWPGLNANLASRMPPEGRGSREILDQIALTRSDPGASGEIFFSMRTLMADPDSLGERLVTGPYASRALVPPSPWLDPRVPRTPWAELRVDPASHRYILNVAPGGGHPQAHLWVAQVRTSAGWTTAILPAVTREYVIGDASSAPADVRVYAVSRTGILSAPARLAGPSPGAGGR